MVLKKEIVVALAGNPNSGKTTIFNNLTGANQHVGNYPGVTVEKKEGHLNYRGYRIKAVDLPGTYSLSAYSIDEIIARKFIIEQKPDVIIDIVDASNIERNLYLTTQLSELNVHLLIALNMSDMAKNRGIIINTEYLAQLMGIPIVPTVGNKKKGMTELLNAIIEIVENGVSLTPVQVSYGKEIERELSKLNDIISTDSTITNSYKPRWLSLKLLEDDAEVYKLLKQHKSSEQIFKEADKSKARLKSLYRENLSEIITDRRYGFISGACSEAINRTAEHRHDVSDKIDYVLIHPISGLLIFAGMMWLVFHLTFTLAEKPMEWIELAMASLANLFLNILPEGILNSLIVDGIIGGVGGVIVFLPNIMFLFLAIAVLEDTGYMSRAAFIMDRIMHRIGLHGKSFIPMLIGYGCSVPAYLGSRIIEDKTDRLVTMHVITFMSCGARLPIYVLVCGAFWPDKAGNVMFSIYVLGIVVAIVMVKLLRATRFKGLSAPFVMELPPYRIPTIRSLLIHMWERSWMYLRKAGTVILSFSIIMWFLMTFPQKKTYDKDYDALVKLANHSFSSEKITLSERDSLITAYENSRSAENLEYSIAGRIGKNIEPIIKPLGFDWRLGIALISGFVAKEVVVSTMGTIYGVGETDEGSEALRASLAADPKYSKLIAYAFLVFVLLYVPCMAAMAVFLRETRSIKETLFQIGYTTALAWFLAMVVYQGGKLLGLS